AVRTFGFSNSRRRSATVASAGSVFGRFTIASRTASPVGSPSIVSVVSPIDLHPTPRFSTGIQVSVCRIPHRDPMCFSRACGGNRHLVRRVATLLAGGVSLLLLGGCRDEQSTLEPKSHAARSIATMWWVLFTLSAVVVAVVTLL